MKATNSTWSSKLREDLTVCMANGCGPGIKPATPRWAAAQRSTAWASPALPRCKFIKMTLVSIPHATDSIQKWLLDKYSFVQIILAWLASLGIMYPFVFGTENRASLANFNLYKRILIQQPFLHWVSSSRIWGSLLGFRLWNHLASGVLEIGVFEVLLQDFSWL